MRHTVFQQNIILTLIVEIAGFFTVIFETEESQEGEFYRMSISFFKNNEIRLNTMVNHSLNADWDEMYYIT